MKAILLITEFASRFLFVGLIGVFGAACRAEIIGANLGEDHLGGQDIAGDSPSSEMLSLAWQALKRNDLQAARNLMQNAAEGNADLYHPEVMMAQGLMKTGRHAQAFAIMDKLAVAEPDRSDLRLVYAQFALHQRRIFDAWMHVIAAENSELPDEWSDEYGEAFRTSLLRTKASAAARLEKAKTAKEIYEKLIEQEEHPNDLVQLAAIELAQGNSEVAEDLVRRSCASPKFNAIPEVVLAAMCDQTKKSDECEQWFKRGLSLSGDESNSVRLKYATWLIRNNRSDDAKEILEGADPTEATKAAFRYATGLAERMSGNIEAAGKIFQKLCSRDPKNRAYNNQLALILIETNDESNHEIALKIADENARSIPLLSDYVATLGWIQLKRGELDRAENLLNLAFQQGNKSPDTLYYLHELKVAQGKKQEAELIMESLPLATSEFYNKRHVTP